jgi:hypothetical protein
MGYQEKIDIRTCETQNKILQFIVENILVFYLGAADETLILTVQVCVGVLYCANFLFKSLSCQRVDVV